MIDWEDIAIHGGIGLAVGFTAGLFGFVWAPLAIGLLLLNGAFWIMREASQALAKGQPLKRLLDEPQKLMEWAVPCATGAMGFALAWAIVGLL